MTQAAQHSFDQLEMFFRQRRIVQFLDLVCYLLELLAQGYQRGIAIGCFHFQIGGVWGRRLRFRACHVGTV
jgi:hypothetical protein